MADSYTASLNLTKVEVNASATTWGNKWNSNADLIDSAAVSLQAQITALAAALAVANVAAVPVGGIVAYNGSVAPTGWHICDGTGGTPDLRNKFIVGAGAAYTPGAQGGADTVVLLGGHLAAHSHGVIDPGHAHGVSDPSHFHTGTTSTDGSHTHGLDQAVLGGSATGGPGGAANVFGMVAPTTTTAGAHLHALSTTYNYTGVTVNGAGTGISIGSSGSNSAHENRPPYYALIFILRLV